VGGRGGISCQEFIFIKKRKKKERTTSVQQATRWELRRGYRRSLLLQPTRSYLDGGTGGEITVAFFFDHPLSCANCGARRDIGFDAPHPGASCPHRLPCGLRYYAHMIGWVGNPEGCGVWGRDGRGEGRGGEGKRVSSETNSRTWR